MAAAIALGAAPAMAQSQFDFYFRYYMPGTYMYPARNTAMVYRLMQPQSVVPGRKYPLLIYLHSAGAQGNDNEKTMYGVMGNLLFHPALAEMNPDWTAFALVPQAPSGTSWGHEPDGRDKNGTWPNDAIPAMVDWLAATYPVDTDRVYLTGASMGGAGTWDIYMQYKSKFAAAIVATGVGQTAKIAALLDKPVWAFINADDSVNPVTGPRYPGNASNVYFGPRDLMNALRTMGSPVLFTEPVQVGGARRLPAFDQRHVYTEYARAADPNNTHNVTNQCYNERRLVEWVFSQTLRGPQRPAAPTDGGATAVDAAAGGGLGGTAGGGGNGVGDAGDPAASGGSGGQGSASGGLPGTGGDPGTGGSGVPDGAPASGCTCGLARGALADPSVLAVAMCLVGLGRVAARRRRHAGNVRWSRSWRRITVESASTTSRNAARAPVSRPRVLPALSITSTRTRRSSVTNADVNRL